MILQWYVPFSHKDSQAKSNSLLTIYTVYYKNKISHHTYVCNVLKRPREMEEELVKTTKDNLISVEMLSGF